MSKDAVSLIEVVTALCRYTLAHGSWNLTAPDPTMVRWLIQSSAADEPSRVCPPDPLREAMKYQPGLSREDEEQHAARVMEWAKAQQAKHAANKPGHVCSISPASKDKEQQEAFEVIKWVTAAKK